MEGRVGGKALGVTEQKTDYPLDENLSNLVTQGPML
jgi:hypothetical protein